MFCDVYYQHWLNLAIRASPAANDSLGGGSFLEAGVKYTVQNRRTQRTEYGCLVLASFWLEGTNNRSPTKKKDCFGLEKGLLIVLGKYRLQVLVLFKQQNCGTKILLGLICELIRFLPGRGGLSLLSLCPMVLIQILTVFGWEAQNSQNMHMM